MSKLTPIFVGLIKETMTTITIQIGDFVKGSYKYGCVSGLVKKINKNTVVVSQYQQFDDTYTAMGRDMNITISRIYDVNPAGITLKDKVS